MQKVLAAAGLGSRRDCEELIVSGRVEVDGEIVTELGSKVDPSRQEIRVDGVALPRPRRVHYMLNKPEGVLCTNDDPSGRVLAVDLVRSNERLFTVGRLDASSEGLILITNDGELANQLTHPRYGVEKRYLVRVVGSPNPVVLDKLRRGVRLAEGIARVSDIRVRKRTSKFTDMEMVLQEGRNREIRRILARVGHKVVRLKRIAIGPLKLGELPVGASRVLTRDEVRKLQEASHNSRHKERTKPESRPRTAGDRPSSGRPSSGRPSRANPVSPASRQPAAVAKPSRKPLAPSPAPLTMEADEVEVTEVPMDLNPGAIIGSDDDWGPVAPHASKSSGRKHRRT